MTDNRVNRINKISILSIGMVCLFGPGIAIAAVLSPCTVIGYANACYFSDSMVRNRVIFS